MPPSRSEGTLRPGAVLAALLTAGLILTVTASSARSVSPDLDAYRGLGTWVDLYDVKTFTKPERTIRTMKARGVRTLFLETGNYRQKVDVVRRKYTGRFVDAAHAAGLKVVAWYLPSFASPKRDYRRALKAIRFTSRRGQQFDSFALDIEASVVRNVTLRNRRLLSLSARIRRAAGASYPLGAIIPAPRGMQLAHGYWPGFPYRGLAKTYDVFLPMGYFSYRPHDLGGPFGYTVRNVTLIRRGTGNPDVVIHAIGGLSESSSAAKVQGFVRATRVCGVDGASMYDFSTTRAGGWKQLKRVRMGSRPSGSRCS